MSNVRLQEQLGSSLEIPTSKKKSKAGGGREEGKVCVCVLWGGRKEKSRLLSLIHSSQAAAEITEVDSRIIIAQLNALRCCNH